MNADEKLEEYKLEVDAALKQLRDEIAELRAARQALAATARTLTPEELAAEG